MRRTSDAILSVVLLFGCGAPQYATASGHEREAETEERAARADEARYDPHARTMMGTHGPAAQFGVPPDVFNPTEQYRDRAERHRQHANEHRRQATELRTFEAQECAFLPEATREACPLLLGVEQMEDVDGGVRITFASGDEMAPIVEHLRCHIAFAAAEGRDGMENCALYVPGAQVRAEGHVVLLTTNDGRYVAELRRRARLQAP